MADQFKYNFTFESTLGQTGRTFATTFLVLFRNMGDRKSAFETRVAKRPQRFLHLKSWQRWTLATIMTNFSSIFLHTSPAFFQLYHSLNQCDQMGNFLYFGQIFKARGNNYLTQITNTF